MNPPSYIYVCQTDNFTLAFLSSLKGLINISDVDFVLHSNTWNFLMASWLKDKDDGRYDFELSIHLRENVLKRSTALSSEGSRAKHVCGGMDMNFVIGLEMRSYLV